jgi:putative addiction module killer protein
MLELRQTDVFRRWRLRLRDDRARALIASRLDRLAYGHVGDARSIGDGVSELRIHYGPGYRVYFARRGSALVLLLCGGDKGSQARDIAMAKRLIAEWSE